MKFRVLTPTKDRPEALALLSRWLLRQTRQDFEWWIVCDGEKTPKFPEWGDRLNVLKREPAPKDTHSLNANIVHALDNMPQNLPVAICEDDDYYAPRYLQVMMDQIKMFAIAGLAPAFYYNLRTRTYKDCGNQHHSSLATTILTPHALPFLREAATSPPDSPKQREHWSKWGEVPFLDIRLWKRVGGRIQRVLEDGKPLQVGVKGMPGTTGIGIGHRMDKRNDPDLEIFKQWLGDDWTVYKEYIGA